MDVPKIIPVRKPEEILQEKIINYLRQREWYVRSTHGNMFQSGFPDLWCSHVTFGQRWVEVKVRDNHSFTPAQIKEFPLMSAHGTHIWILVDASDAEYAKLFCAPNWAFYYHQYFSRCRSVNDPLPPDIRSVSGKKRI